MLLANNVGGFIIKVGKKKIIYASNLFTFFIFDPNTP